MSREFLSTYLNDHLAGAQAALEVVSLLRTLSDSDVWRSVEEEIAADRHELQGLMQSTGAAPSTVRRATAWTAEKLAELKMRMDDWSADALLRRLELIEALAIGMASISDGIMFFNMINGPNMCGKGLRTIAVAFLSWVIEHGPEYEDDK